MYDHASLLHCATPGAATKAKDEIDRRELKGESLTFMFNTSKAAAGATLEESNDRVKWNTVGSKDVVKFKENIGYTGSKRYVRSDTAAVVIITKTGFLPSESLPKMYDAVKIDSKTVTIEFDTPIEVAQKNRVAQFFKIEEFYTKNFCSVSSVSVSDDGFTITAELAKAMDDTKTYKTVLTEGAVKDSHGAVNAAHTFFIRRSDAAGGAEPGA